MNEHSDTEFARAVKESAANSLEGWEFTPAMQRSVLERIERAATGTVPGSHPAQRFDPRRAIRPLAWTAVAAATLLVVVNSRIGGRGAARQSGTVAGTMQQSLVPPVAKGSDPAGKASQPGATSPPGNAPGSMQDATQGAGPSSSAPGGAAQPPAPTTPAPANQGREPNTPPQTKQPKHLTQPASGAGPKTLSAAPDQFGIASVPNEREGSAPQAPPDPYEGGKVALTVPPPQQSKHNPRVGLMAAAASDKLRVQAVGNRVVELSRSGVRTLTSDGADTWIYPLTGATETSLLAVAEDGSVAVAVAEQLHVLSGEGKLLRTLEPAGKVTDLAWGPGGRLAIAAGSVVSVIRPATATAEFHSEAIGHLELSFSTDGTLAVVGDGTSGRQLLIYDKGGALTARVQQGRAKGQGLVFTPGVVLAGSQAYSLLGRPLWQTPFAPEGLTEVGTNLIVARKADAVVVLRAASGVPIWQATWSGSGHGLRRVVAAPDGRFLAVLGSTDEGWVLWILDQKGKVLHAERLSEEPSDMAFVGDRLMLLTAQGAEFRAFSQ